MRRFSAHYIVFPVRNIHKLHYIELDDQAHLKSINPLTNEIANTLFYNGVLLIANATDIFSSKELGITMEIFFEQFPEATLSEFMEYLQLSEVKEGSLVAVYHLDGIDLLSAKLRANNSGSNCHIQRLC